MEIWLCTDTEAGCPDAAMSCSGEMLEAWKFSVFHSVDVSFGSVDVS